MKKIFISGMLLFCFCLSRSQNSADRVDKKGIYFYRDLSWQKIREKAKLEHKYIFVDCFATWCGPCKQMDKNVYTADIVGDFYNKTFISYKIQCDTSRNDDEMTKAAYVAAHQVVTEYKIAAYPTFLFFTPDGKLVHIGLGYQEATDFITLGREATDPSKQYFTLLKNYQKGNRDYASMPYLAKIATRLDDSQISRLVERDYIENYLNKLPDAEIGEKDNLELLRDFVQLLHSNDRSFKWILEHTQLADSITQKTEFSIGIMISVMYREEIKPMVETAEKNNAMPDWDKMETKLTAKIGIAATKKAIWKGKLDWYKFKNDWEDYYAIVIEIIETGRFKDNPGSSANALTLNQAAFEIFLHSSDKNKLEKALSWMDLVVNNITDSSAFAGDMYDTKAELLYKLARKEEALVLEARAVEVSPNNKEIRGLYKRMLEGQPTW